MATPDLGRIIAGDCLEAMEQLPEGFVDLAFADPPFNIGYAYDVYDDRRTGGDYLAWCEKWMRGVHRLLKPDGTFWLAIGDEYAAELKVLATRTIGFSCRNWVVWYYTFGVHCARKFARSHAHLFYFTRNAKKFRFNAKDPAVRVPSARQLVYGDRRANPSGRLPDDTWLIRPAPEDSWVLRPQDLPEGFSSNGDTWYFPRVAGTFKERMGFHGCQMPEQLLARIIRACSNAGDTVFDPFTGSGTTLAVAKKLGRNFLGTEMSEEYQAQATERLNAIRGGDPIDGTENPLKSVPRTSDGVRLTASGTRAGHRRPLGRARRNGRTAASREPSLFKPA